MMQNRSGSLAAFSDWSRGGFGGIVGVRAFGWQVDVRQGMWLPLGVRTGRTPGWFVVRLGSFGHFTIGRMR